MSNGTAESVLTIDLGALAENYRRLRDRLKGAVCAAVVKADGYGIGAARAATTFAAEGCTVFFVAQVSEGAALRPILPTAEIYVLSGPTEGTAKALVAERLVPVLNHLGEIEIWAALARQHGGLSAALHIDTGMSRLGLPPDEVATLAAEPERLAGIDVRCVLSHLACAEQTENPMNARQLAEFNELRARLAPAPASIANSSGIFLGPEYHLDLARPGIALYGSNPTPGKPNPMAEVVRLQGKIAQVREIDTPLTVGYGATHRASGPTRIATVPVGYADGYLRALSNRGYCYIGKTRVAVVGRISMDLITLDVTAVPRERAHPGAVVDLIGGPVPIDEVAERAGTIAHEVLTRLGRRYQRNYVGGTA